MLLTHSMLTVYVAIFCIIYLLVNIKEIKKDVLILLFQNAIWILLLTIFYWAPLIESKLAADYEVFNQEHMVRYDAMIVLKPSIGELFVHFKGRMPYGLGIIVIVGTVLSIFTIKKLKEKKNFILFLVLGIICTITSLDFFPFEELPSIFTMMQFSFRMLEFAAFFLVIVSSIALGKEIEKFNIYTVVTLICISILLLLPSVFELHYGRYFEESDLEAGIRVTSSTGRVHAGCASFEYLPTKAFKNRKYIEDREDVPVVLNTEQYVIENFNKDNTNCEFDIKSFEGTDTAQIELPYIYYIGYNVTFVDDNGEETRLETYESENGFLCVNVDAPGKIKVRYTGTLLMQISALISVLSAIAYVGIFAKGKS